MESGLTFHARRQFCKYACTGDACALETRRRFATEREKKESRNLNPGLTAWVKRDMIDQFMPNTHDISSLHISFLRSMEATIFILENKNLKRIENRASRIEHRESRIENRESRIENRESRIENRESRIENRESRIENRESRIENRESRIENRESRIENRESRIENRESRIENRESRIENRESIIYRKFTHDVGIDLKCFSSRCFQSHSLHPRVTVLCTILAISLISF